MCEQQHGITVADGRKEDIAQMLVGEDAMAAVDPRERMLDFYKAKSIFTMVERDVQIRNCRRKREISNR